MADLLSSSNYHFRHTIKGCLRGTYQTTATLSIFLAYMTLFLSLTQPCYFFICQQLLLCTLDWSAMRILASISRVVPDIHGSFGWLFRMLYGWPLSFTCAISRQKVQFICKVLCVPGYIILFAFLVHELV